MASHPQTFAFAVTAAAVVATAIAFTATNKNQQRRPNGEDAFQIPLKLLESPYATELTLAVKMALAAGKNMYDYCDQAGTEAAQLQDLGISTKGKPEDFCTKIDLENEKAIMAEIQRQFPSHQIIGEEAVGQGTIPPLSKETPTWIIDRTCRNLNSDTTVAVACSISFISDQLLNLSLQPSMGRPILPPDYH